MKFLKNLFHRLIEQPVDKKINKVNFEHKLKTYTELMANSTNRHEQLILMRRYGLAFADLIDSRAFARYHPRVAADVSVNVPFYTSVDYCGELSLMCNKIETGLMDFDDHWLAKNIYQDVGFDLWISQYHNKYIDIPATVDTLRTLILKFFEKIEGIEEAEYGYYEALRRRYDAVINDIFNLTYAILTVQQRIVHE